MGTHNSALGRSAQPPLSSPAVNKPRCQEALVLQMPSAGVPSPPSPGSGPSGPKEGDWTCLLQSLWRSLWKRNHVVACGVPAHRRASGIPHYGTVSSRGWSRPRCHSYQDKGQPELPSGQLLTPRPATVLLLTREPSDFGRGRKLSLNTTSHSLRPSQGFLIWIPFLSPIQKCKVSPVSKMTTLPRIYIRTNCQQPDTGQGKLGKHFLVKK